MLVLTRRKNEQIVITLGMQTVLIRVLDVKGDRVRVGIAAPIEVDIQREEVARRDAGVELDLRMLAADLAACS